MRKYLIMLNLLNALDGLVTYLGITAYGTSIEYNTFLHDNTLVMILLIKIPTLLGISWLLLEYDKHTKHEKRIFVTPVLIALSILFIFVLIWNGLVLMGKL